MPYAEYRREGSTLLRRIEDGEWESFDLSVEWYALGWLRIIHEINRGLVQEIEGEPNLEVVGMDVVTGWIAELEAGCRE